MSETASPLVSGGIVKARGRRWKVLRIVAGMDCSIVDLQPVEPNGHAGRATLLAPFDRIVPEASSTRPRTVGARRWKYGLRAMIAAAAPADGLQPAAWARIALHPYQLEPALAVVRDGATRVLLADEVGLGKTIQAGLIISALVARGQASRVLVLVPAGLRWQWAEELRGRFGLEPAIIDAETLRRRVAGLPRSVNPWLIPGLFLSSFDYVKQEEVLQALRLVGWDVVVVDEAHAVAAPGTERGTAARQLAARARRVVLVTATPHAGSDEEFAALCGIGLHENGHDGSPILLFRRSRAAVGLRVDRRVRLIRVRLHGAERLLHDALGRYVRAVWRHAPAGSRAGSRLAMLVLSKRALSSAGSLATSIERRAAILALDPAAVLEQLALPLTHAAPETTSDDADEEPGLRSLGVPGLGDASRERLWLGRLLALAREATRHESKLAVLQRLLSRTRDTVIVFTEYRDTLVSVARSLGTIAPLAVLHGGLSGRERQNALEAFANGTARVLLTTDAAGEGLNLHARCRWVVSLELPWSPRRIEQRIGRVDRIGQTRRVHALHLVATGTAEGHLLARLALKMDRVRRQVGSSGDFLGITEEAVLQAIVDGRSTLPQGRPVAGSFVRSSAIVGRSALGEVAVAECERLERVRRLAVGGFARAGEGARHESRDVPDALRRTGAQLERRRPWAAVVRAAGRPEPLARAVNEVFGLAVTRGSCVLIVRVALEAEAGWPFDESLHAIPTVFAAAPRPARASQISARLDGLLRHGWTGIGLALHQQVSARTDIVLGHHIARVRLELAREEDVLRVLTADGTARLQPSLFDRRTEREAGDRLASLAISLDESTRRCAELERMLRCDWPQKMEPVLALIGI